MNKEFIFVLVIGSVAMVLMVGAVIFFVVLYQQKLIKKAAEYKMIEALLKDLEISTLNSTIDTQEAERKRIATELHDRVGSMLSAVKLHFGAFSNNDPQNPKVLMLSKLLDDSLDEVRRISHNMTSGVLSKFGLEPALVDLKRTINASDRISMEIYFNNIDKKMSKDLEINLYRIIQESVSNVLKHADATEINVQLTRHEDGHLTLMIEDNGRGFDVNQAKSNSMGLQNIKNRASTFNGELNIDSFVGHGTTITIDFPISSAE
ncbi:sensor histidine kinase [Flammeovirgaceae bacterium SG7u.111]|nr:sensor histidine kinase [Flammeovirgaceae bacterium SG7u.132]WPO36643.1 sensor histidine kinase [Flammeovirgaceae bacterium SG7u.111]